jgi:hypothetical protein
MWPSLTLGLVETEMFQYQIESNRKKSGIDKMINNIFGDFVHFSPNLCMVIFLETYAYNLCAKIAAF